MTNKSRVLSDNVAPGMDGLELRMDEGFGCGVRVGVRVGVRITD